MHDNAAALAHKLCQKIEARMRRMGIVTTAHYDAGCELIAQAIREAEKRGADAERKRIYNLT